MHVEIQVALNFFISFLYNKLPRRRVNQFGEELERALKFKFLGHWYPERPFKGSAFRCIKTAPPLDPVFDIAAHEAGMALADIQENLPDELCIWIDPGEVSYRLGEKGVVKILYSESESSEDRADREIYRTFNPEAQSFRPIESGSVTSQMGSMSISSNTPSTGSQSSSSSPYGNSPSPTYKSSSSPNSNNGFLTKTSIPLTFTTATFAQTKFGSTKLKTNGKRNHRMSPTEFSSYIKQRALIQQQQQQHPPPMFVSNISQHQQQQQPRPRSLSPTPATNGAIDANGFLMLASAANLQQQQSNPSFTPNHQFSPRSHPGVFDGYLGDMFSTPPTNVVAHNNNTNANKLLNQRPAPNVAAAVSANANALSLFFDNKSILHNNSGLATVANISSASATNSSEGANNKGFSSIDTNLNFNVVGGAVTYPNQHLLMAN